MREYACACLSVLVCECVCGRISVRVFECVRKCV